jgi:ribonuclease HII
VGGDRKVYEIAGASIVAKCVHDEQMVELSKQDQYKKYEFEKHKGYGTPRHRALIAEHGPSNVHRLTFASVKSNS